MLHAADVHHAKRIYDQIYTRIFRTFSINNSEFELVGSFLFLHVKIQTLTWHIRTIYQECNIIIYIYTYIGMLDWNSTISNIETWKHNLVYCSPFGTSEIHCIHKLMNAVIWEDLQLAFRRRESPSQPRLSQTGFSESKVLDSLVCFEYSLGKFPCPPCQLY